MKLVEQRLQVHLHDPMSNLDELNGVAEIRISVSTANKWVGEAHIRPWALAKGEYFETKREAQTALAAALRKLADLVESDT